MLPESLTVELGDRSYPITAGGNLLADAARWLKPHLRSDRVIILSDERLLETHLPTLVHSLETAGVRCDLMPVPSGEASKSLAAYAAISEAILELRPERKTTLLTLGGGVVGDLGGFIAATLLRGLPFIQIPTTLLSQVDSSVGGKTGLNSAAGKNLIGAFYQPQAVLIDTNTLNTLPERELRAGYAEIVKYGALGDADFFAQLERDHARILSREPEALTRTILHCCASKAAIVAEDEREAGKRALLNLGHTFGHALEAEAGYDGTLLHGEGVSIGMVMAAHLSHQLGLCDASVEQRLRDHLHAAHCPVSPADIRPHWSAEALLSHFSSDKKNQDGKWVMILMKALGEAVIVKDVAREAVRETLLAFDGVDA